MISWVRKHPKITRSCLWIIAFSCLGFGIVGEINSATLFLLSYLILATITNHLAFPERHLTEEALNDPK